MDARNNLVGGGQLDHFVQGLGREEQGFAEFGKIGGQAWRKNLLLSGGRFAAGEAQLLVEKILDLPQIYREGQGTGEFDGGPETGQRTAGSAGEVASFSAMRSSVLRSAYSSVGTSRCTLTALASSISGAIFSRVGSSDRNSRRR